MNEFIKKMIERLEEKQNIFLADNTDDGEAKYYAYGDSISIVNKLAEEYKHCALCYLGSPCEYQNPEADCEKCEEYNSEKHYCPKFCKVITEAVEEIEENHNNDFCEWNCGGQVKTLVALWETSCGNKHIMQKTEGYKFCPYCGKKIKVIGD